MNASRTFVIAFAFLAVAATARAADPVDAASLFPPSTLAFAEIRDPAAVGPQLAAAFKGSQIEDSIAYIHKRRDNSKDPRDHFMKEQLAVLGLIASPEMASEFKRFGGVAIGLTGFNAQQQPEFAVAVLTGDSAAAGLAARAFLTLTSVRKTGTIGDTPVYQLRQAAMGYDPNGQRVLQEKTVTEGAYEPTFAYVPGLIVAGTSKAALAEVVTRFQGKANGSLAEQADFKAAAAGYRKPGLFLYANVPAYLAKVDEATRTASGTPMPEMQHDSLAWLKLLANAKSMRYAAGNVAFRDGGLAVSFGGGLEPGQKSPLFDLLNAPGVKVTQMRHAPLPATVAVTLSFPEANRAATILSFLDALAKSNGELGRTPSEAVKELDTKFKMSIADSLLGKTAGATLVLPAKQDLPKGAVPLPLLVLHGESAAVATGWAELLPKLLGDMAGGDAPQPVSETIDGLKVISLPAGNLPWKAAVHLTQKGEVFAVGLDRKLVAAAANGAEPPALSVPAENASAIGVLGTGAFVRLLTAVKLPDGPVVPRGPAAPVKTVPNGFGRGGLNGFDDDGPIPDVDPTNLPDGQKKKEAQARIDLNNALDTLPALSFAAKRTGGEVRVDVYLPKVHGVALAPFVNASLAWYDQLLNRTANPNQGHYGPRFGRFGGGW
ncbi:MAG: hypothetical protein U0791_20300 [Gemmataceae bacterium]